MGNTSIPICPGMIKTNTEVEFWAKILKFDFREGEMHITSTKQKREQINVANATKIWDCPFEEHELKSYVLHYQ